jgi:hypothetical protein
MFSFYSFPFSKLNSNLKIILNLFLGYLAVLLTFPLVLITFTLTLDAFGGMENMTLLLFRVALLCQPPVFVSGYTL